MGKENPIAIAHATIFLIIFSFIKNRSENRYPAPFQKGWRNWKNGHIFHRNISPYGTDYDIPLPDAYPNPMLWNGGFGEHI